MTYCNTFLAASFMQLHMRTLWLMTGGLHCGVPQGQFMGVPTLYCSCLRVNHAIQGPRAFSVAGFRHAQAGGSLPLNSELDRSSRAALNPISPAQLQPITHMNLPPYFSSHPSLHLHSQHESVLGACQALKVQKVPFVQTCRAGSQAALSDI
jgi:hypothetical protein